MTLSKHVDLIKALDNGTEIKKGDLMLIFREKLLFKSGNSTTIELYGLLAVFESYAAERPNPLYFAGAVNLSPPAIFGGIEIPRIEIVSKLDTGRLESKIGLVAEYYFGRSNVLRGLTEKAGFEYYLPMVRAMEAPYSLRLPNAKSNVPPKFRSAVKANDFDD